MASIGDLNREGFKPSHVKVRQLNIIHRSASSGLPFCRLDVLTEAPSQPGVYAWAVGGTVRFIGDTVDLLATVKGAELGWPGEDQTEISQTDAAHMQSTRVWVNALLNEALHRGQEVTWWWLPTAEARTEAARWIAAWQPVWNKNVAVATAGDEPIEAKAARTTKAAKAPKARPAAKVAEERPVVQRVVCPSCWLEVPASTRYCDDCEVAVP